MSDETLSEKEIETEVLKYHEHAFEVEKRKEIKTNLKLEDMPKSVQDMIPDSDTFKDFKVIKFEEPLTYYILEFNLYRDKQYIYLNENMEPMMDGISTILRKYRADDFLIVSTLCETYTFNNKGDIVWYEIRD